jgi:hypothetical protein
MVYFLAGLSDIQTNLIKNVHFVLKLNIIQFNLCEVPGDLFSVQWKSDGGSTYR